MLIRALIVLLIALNLGAAAWWLAGPGEQPEVAVAQPVGVATLDLLTEATSSSTGGGAGAVAGGAEPAPIAEDEAADTRAEADALEDGDLAAAPAAVALACLAVGPFPDAEAARAAAATLGPGIRAGAPREVPGSAASGYNVFLPATGNRDTALATAARVGQAGFDDYLVVNSGAMANTVALGRYASRERAEARRSDLQAAGFPAQVQPVGNQAPSQWWLDVRSEGASTPQQVRARSGAAQARNVDCATLG